jgi:hypothetical protein
MLSGLVVRKTACLSLDEFSSNFLQRTLGNYGPACKHYVDGDLDGVRQDPVL